MTRDDVVTVQRQRTDTREEQIMLEWYVMRNGKLKGPYSDFQFHRLAEDGAIISTDLVWYTGRQEFIPACKLRGFFAAMPSPADECLSVAVPTSGHLPAWLADYIQSTMPISVDLQIPCARKASYLRRHWRGDLPLELTFWVNGVISFFAIYTLPIVALGIIVSRSNPVRTWIYLLGFLAALTLITVWQIVGIWRSAGKHRSRGGKSVWGWSARAVVVLFALNNGERLVRYTPFILDGSMARFGYDQLGTYQIRLSQDGTELEVSGYLTFGVTEDVLKTLDSAHVKIIHLNSKGGRMGEGHDLQKLIRARSLTTHTANESAVHAPLLFLAGRNVCLARKRGSVFTSPGLPV